MVQVVFLLCLFPLFFLLQYSQEKHENFNSIITGFYTNDNKFLSQFWQDFWLGLFLFHFLIHSTVGDPFVCMHVCKSLWFIAGFLLHTYYFGIYNIGIEIICSLILQVLLRLEMSHQNLQKFSELMNGFMKSQQFISDVKGKTRPFCQM